MNNGNCHDVCNDGSNNGDGGGGRLMLLAVRMVTSLAMFMEMLSRWAMVAVERWINA